MTQEEATAKTSRDEFQKMKERFSIALDDCKKYLQFMADNPSENSEAPCSDSEKWAKLEEKLSQLNSIKNDLHQKMDLLEDDGDSNITEIKDIEAAIREWDILQDQIIALKKKTDCASEQILTDPDNGVQTDYIPDKVKETSVETEEHHEDLTDPCTVSEKENGLDTQIPDEVNYFVCKC